MLATEVPKTSYSVTDESVGSSLTVRFHLIAVSFSVDNAVTWPPPVMGTPVLGGVRGTSECVFVFGVLWFALFLCRLSLPSLS